MSEQIQQQLQEVFRKVFSNAELTISESTTAKDIYGWDSLTHMHLLHEIEQHFNVAFNFSEASSFENVGDIGACIEQKINL